jgi:hypothetical protein
MWMLQLIAISVLVGVVAGVVWRLAEDWLERRSARLAQEELTGTEQPTESTPTIVVTAVTTVDVPAAPVSKSN